MSPFVNNPRHVQVCIGVIQKIRDTRRGGGFDEVSHILFIILKMFFVLLEEKLAVTKQDTALKDTLFLIDLIFQSNIGLKISHQKMKNVTLGGGGVRKVPKSVTYYLNGPI
jgi:hypothetical protein